MNILAEIILYFHFIIFFFIRRGFVVIPLGYLLKWNFVKIKLLRLIHLLLMTFVTFETILGFMCPLTYFEKFLRNDTEATNLITIVLHKIMYWDFPSHYFIILYIICFIYLLFLWYIFKPDNNF